MRASALMVSIVFAAECFAAQANPFAQPGEPARQAASPQDPMADPWIAEAGFDAAHPELRERAKGMQAYRRGDYETALRYFRRAAYHADKASQGMVAEMLWHGSGVQRDRALAYAWMDLAAERGYRTLAIKREQYWNSLDQDERRRALEEGVDLYTRYGDDVALSRYATRLRIERSRATGSRTGFASNMQILVPVGANAGSPSFVTLDGSRFYAREYWYPKAYVQWSDARWEAEVEAPRIGQVEVREPETVREPDEP
jgi:tetratricopeptide (TPR) repeat protein